MKKIRGFSTDSYRPSTTKIRSDGLIQMDIVCAPVYQTLSAKEALLVLVDIAIEAMAQIEMICKNTEKLRWI